MNLARETGMKTGILNIRDFYWHEAIILINITSCHHIRNFRLLLYSDIDADEKL